MGGRGLETTMSLARCHRSRDIGKYMEVRLMRNQTLLDGSARPGDKQCLASAEISYIAGRLLPVLSCLHS